MTTVLQVPCYLLLASPVPVVSVWPAPCCAVYLCLCCVSTRHYALHSTEAAGRYTSPHTDCTQWTQLAITKKAPLRSAVGPHKKGENTELLLIEQTQLDWTPKFRLGAG